MSISKHANFWKIPKTIAHRFSEKWFKMTPNFYYILWYILMYLYRMFDLPSLSPSLSAYMHISKTIEACRVHLFDIVTQYKAIFPDDDTMLLSTHTSYTGKQADGTLFCGWLNSKVKIIIIIIIIIMIIIIIINKILPSLSILIYLPIRYGSFYSYLSLIYWKVSEVVLTHCSVSACTLVSPLVGLGLTLGSSLSQFLYESLSSHSNTLWGMLNTGEELGTDFT